MDKKLHYWVFGTFFTEKSTFLKIAHDVTGNLPNIKKLSFSCTELFHFTFFTVESQTVICWGQKITETLQK